MFLIVDKNEEGYVYREFGGFTEKGALKDSFDYVVENGDLPEGFASELPKCPKPLAWAFECKCPPEGDKGRQHNIRRVTFTTSMADWLMPVFPAPYGIHV
jgi:hypothetical protein